MKEFHLCLAQAQHNKAQFTQLIKDCYREIKFEQRGFFDVAAFLNFYYGMNFSCIEVGRLGKFIKAGKHMKELELYVKLV